MPTSTNIVEFVARGQENVKKAFDSVGDAARKTSDRVKTSGIATAEVGKKSEIAADGMKDFAESMARGEGVASALQATIAPLSSGLFALGTTLSMGLAVVIPFVVMGLASLIGESKTLGEVVDELNNSFQNYQSAAAAAAASTSELKAKYGEAWQEAKMLLEQQRELQLVMMQQDFSEAFGGLIDHLTGTGILFAGLQESIRGVATHFGVTVEQGELLRQKLIEIYNAKTFEEKVAAAQAFTLALEEAGIKLEDLPRGVAQVIVETNNLVLTQKEATAAVEGTTTATNNATAATSAWANEMRNVASAAAAAAAALGAMQSARAQSQVNLARENRRAAAIAAGNDPNAAAAQFDAELTAANGVRDSGGSAAVQREGQRFLETQQKLAKQIAANQAAMKNALSLGGGGGGGGGSAVKAQKNDVDDLTKSVKTAKDTTDDWFSSMQLKSTDTRDEWINAFDAMGNAVGEFVKTGKLDIDSLFATIAEGFIDLAMKQAMYGSQGGFGGILGAIMGSFGGGTLGGTSTLGGDPSASALSAVNGGGGLYFNGGVVSQPTKFYANGGLASMAEKGAEAIMPLARNSRGQLGVYGDVGGGGQNNITFNTTVTVQGGDTSEETANRTAKMIDQALDYKIQKALSKQMNTGGGKNRR